MKDFQFAAEVYSPRWGHTDRYSLSMTRTKMTVSLAAMKSAVCELAENGDPVWSGYSGSDNPVMNIFRNDNIYAPCIVPFALEWAWERWREGDTEEQVIRDGLKELFAWIDQTARGKPGATLWDGAF